MNFMLQVQELEVSASAGRAAAEGGGDGGGDSAAQGMLIISALLSLPCKSFT